MKKWRNLSLNLKLMACFLSAIFVLSAFHLGSYMRLLNTMTHEAEASANERMTSAVTRLDESLSHIRNSYFSLTYTPAFRTASRSGDPSEYELVDLYDKAELYLGNNENISAFAIFFRNSSKVVTSSGNYLDTEFFPVIIQARSMTRISGVKKNWPPLPSGIIPPPRFPATALFQPGPAAIFCRLPSSRTGTATSWCCCFWILMRSAPKRTSI